jgi:exopolysaccharide biosynthesis polyprenyl glycosylphosphotransferase
VSASQSPLERLERLPAPARAPLTLAPRERRPRASVQRRDRTFRWALLGADLVASAFVVVLGLAWLGDGGPAYSALPIVVLAPLTLAGAGLYRRDERLINKTTLDEAAALFQASTLITLLAFLVESAVLQRPMGATVVAFTWLGLILALPACRVAARALVREALRPERCLVIGDDEHGRRVAAKLAAPGVNAELAAVIGLDGHDDPVPARRRHRTLTRLAELVQAHEVDRVVVAVGGTAGDQELESIQAAKALGVKVSVLPRVLEVVGASGTYDYLDGLTLLGVPRFGLTRRAQMVKRGFDLAAAGVGLVLLAPLLAVIAVGVRLDSSGPVLFRQTRIGRDGTPFRIFKFRSMCVDAEFLKDTLRHRNEAVGLFKITDDPRITRVGRLLRKTSLDELPQLFNVLRGEMSLVGPRPLVPDEDERIEGWHRDRLQLVPGMTGPWQVLGSARIPLDEMVAIDYLYVASYSMWGDVKLLLRTLAAVADRRGR